MNPGRYNITVVKGTTFTLSPEWLIDNLPVDLTGYSAQMQVRQFVDSVTPLTTASTANGKIVLAPALGQINITLTATETGTFAVGNYIYSLQLTSPSSIVTELLTGNFIVSPSAVQ